MFVWKKRNALQLLIHFKKLRVNPIARQTNYYSIKVVKGTMKSYWDIDIDEKPVVTERFITALKNKIYKCLFQYQKMYIFIN